MPFVARALKPESRAPTIPCSWDFAQPGALPIVHGKSGQMTGAEREGWTAGGR